MAIGLDPITVAEAGPIMAKAMGFDWAKDRLEVVEYLNKYRLLLYTNYPKFQLFNNVFHCICISEFEQCCSDEDSTYQGFSLPSDVLGVETVWSYGRPMIIRSRWRESHNGIGVQGLGRVETVQLAETFATERDLNKISRLKVYAEHEDDTDKKVYIEVIDASNKRKRICFKLIGEGFAISQVRVKKILSVSLPHVKSGSIILSQVDNYELSAYSPWETVPVYQRMKVVSSTEPSTVLVQGTKRYQKIYFDHDIVEVGNQLIIECAARFFKYGETSTERNELQRSKIDISDMETYLKGLIARHRGNAVQDGSPFRGRPLSPKKPLPGYR